MNALKEMFERGELDVTVLLPEDCFSKEGRLRDDLLDGYADDEIYILHRMAETGIGLKGYYPDRRLSEANLEWEHIEIADFCSIELLKHMAEMKQEDSHNASVCYIEEFNGDGWYFWDEAQSSCYGPHETRDEAVKALEGFRDSQMVGQVALDGVAEKVDASGESAVVMTTEFAKN